MKQNSSKTKTGISVHHTGSSDSTQFSIIQSEKHHAIETLMDSLKRGNTVTLADNRNNRMGSVSMRNHKGRFFKTGGGHGFSLDRHETTEEHVAWLIRQLAEFNTGKDEFFTGTMEPNP